jgi:ubiquitin-protein ligase
MADRIKLLITNYVDARKVGDISGYQIRQYSEDSYEKYYIFIKPKSGIYKDQEFVLLLSTNEDSHHKFPLNPPKLSFVTPIYHVNVSMNGDICVDILKEKAKWVPSYSFDAIIQNVLLLMDEPNTSSAYNGEAAFLWDKCNANFNEKLKKASTHKLSESIKIKSSDIKSKKHTVDIKEYEMLKEEAFKPFVDKTKQYCIGIDKFKTWYNNTDYSDALALYESFKKKAIVKDNPPINTGPYISDKPIIENSGCSDSSNISKPKKRWERHISK